MNGARIEHETRRRLRVSADPAADVQALRRRCGELEGVRSVRANPRLHCLVVEHDGAAATRQRVLDLLGAGAPQPPQPGAGSAARIPGLGWDWIPALGALGTLAAPRDWRRAAALATVAARLLAQPQRLRQDPAAVVLDAGSLAALAAAGQGPVVAASVLLRLGAERMSARLVRQADGLLSQLLPHEAAQYRVAGDAAGAELWLGLHEVRAGDRLRLAAGDIVPVDGWVAQGAARVAAAAPEARQHQVEAGDALPAGARLLQGELVLQAETEAAASRLARMREQLRHALESRDPPGPLRPDPGRLVSLPLTAAALVMGLTGDSARAGAMLQADPRQGLDLALPVAREAALYALGRHGLLTGGLEAIERLAGAGTLVLQDTSVLASGRWSVRAVEPVAPATSQAQVLRWLAGLVRAPADQPLPSLPDALVREWVRHGALLVDGGHEVHLASPRRLQAVWGLQLPPRRGRPDAGHIERELAVVVGGRVRARVVLASALRPAAAARLRQLTALGFGRIALFVEDDGQAAPAATDPLLGAAPGLQVVSSAARRDWLSAAAASGQPLVFAHTTLRDLVPPGSLGLTPMDAEAGAHGMLLDDPLASLVAARRAARAVHRRLALHQGAATALNAGLMMASALRWIPPLGTTLLHHGFALVLLLDSLRLEGLAPPQPEPAGDG